MKKYVCSICGYIYDENAGIPDAGIAKGTKWEDLPEGWVCPVCKASKTAFAVKQDEAARPEQPSADVEKIMQPREDEKEDRKGGRYAKLSAICSNLSKGCEKQYLMEEMKLFTELAEYFQKRSGQTQEETFSNLTQQVQKDLEQNFMRAQSAARQEADRGALRALTWSEKVTRMMDSLLKQQEMKRDGFFQDTNIYVCEICGFIYIGKEAPDICPVCKVPKMKIRKVQRG